MKKELSESTKKAIELFREIRKTEKMIFSLERELGKVIVEVPDDEMEAYYVATSGEE